MQQLVSEAKTAPAADPAALAAEQVTRYHSAR